MRFKQRAPRISDTVMLSGWLFADLLLGLVVIFLATNTVGVKLHVIPTPTPQLPTPTPSPTPSTLPSLELEAHKVILTIDTNGLLNDAPSATNDLKNKIHEQSFLRGRRAGLVIAYGSAVDQAQIPRAQSVANKIIAVLQSLGREPFVFIQTSYYDPLYTLYASSQDNVRIDIYLFMK